MDKNVIINEDEIRTACRKIEEYSSELDKQITSYVNVLSKITVDSITAGNYNRALKTFTQYARKLEHQTVIISQKVQEETNKFLSQVDQDDKFIY